MEDTKLAMCRITRKVKTHQEGLDFVNEIKLKLQQTEKITVQHTIHEWSFEETTNEVPV